MNSTDVVKLLTYAQALIPSFRLPDVDGPEFDFMVEVWREHLDDLDPALVFATFDAMVAGENREFVPNAAQLRHAATQHTSGRAPTVDAAWAEVREQIRKHGHVAPQLVTFTHPSIAAVVTALGWQSLCESTNEVADRAHFARMYEARVADDRAGVAVPPAARAVLDQHRPDELGPVTIAGALASAGYALGPGATNGGVDEPVIEPGRGGERVLDRIGRIRIERAIATAGARPGVVPLRADVVDRIAAVELPDACLTGPGRTCPRGCKVACFAQWVAAGEGDIPSKGFAADVTSANEDDEPVEVPAVPCEPDGDYAPDTERIKPAAEAHA